jgi:hypothetical protein
MLTHKILITLTTTSLVCLSAPNAWAAQTMVVNSTSTTTSATTVSSGVASDELVIRYTELAGSKTNAQSLITGLRTGSLVTLVPSITTTTTTTNSASTITFTPTTQKMGYGNINIALSLAKTTLAKQGIANPTPEQLTAALNGGKITLTNGTVVTITGILTQRSAGMGWGKIVQTAGVKLGSVVSHAKTDDDREHASTTKTSKEDRKDMIAKVSSAKNHSTSDEGGSAHSKSSSSSSGNASGSGNSSSASSHSGGGLSSSGSSNGGGKSSGGGNGGGNSGGNGGGNSGGNGGGKK